MLGMLIAGVVAVVDKFTFAVSMRSCCRAGQVKGCSVDLAVL